MNYFPIVIMDYHKKKKIIIAIDGYSSSGKSTLAKLISKKLRYPYIDTGSMYREITSLAIKKKVFNSDLWNIKNFIPILNQMKFEFHKNKISKKINIFFNGKNIQKKNRSRYVTKKTPFIAKIPEIRHKLISIQKKIGKEKGIIIDGRNIGNEVFPESEIKVFLTSSIEVRSYRRYKEMKNQFLSYEEVKKDLIQRDKIDSLRKNSPVKKLSNHIKIDNTFLTIEKQLNLVMRIINKYLLS